MQRIHVLALVLVQTLDLYVENAVRVNDLALRALNVLGKALLVVQLDLGKLLLHGAYRPYIPSASQAEQHRG